MDTQNQATINEPTLMLWTYNPANTPTDVFDIDHIDVYSVSPFVNPTLAPSATIPQSQVNHIGTGMYQFLVPPQTAIGQYWLRIAFHTANPATGGPIQYDFISFYVAEAGAIVTFLTSPEAILPVWPWPS